MLRRPRFRGAILALPLLVLFPLLALAAPVHTTRSDADLLPPDAAGRVSLVIRTDAKEAVATLVKELGGEVRWRFENLDAVSVLVPKERVSELLADSRVGDVARARLVRRAVVTPRLPDPALARVPLRPHRLEADGPFLSVPEADRWNVRSLAVDDLAAPGRDSGPTSFLGYDEMTGASQVWDVTGGGEGTVVAIIDTGVFPGHPLIEGNTIGGMNLVPAEEEEQIDLDGNNEGDGRSFGWDAIENDSHGTFVGGMIAGHAVLELPADSDLAVSVLAHSPESIEIEDDTAWLWLMGTAPGASLYGVKVFPYDGGPAPDARVAEAIDRLITMRRHGQLHVDVINMSLSGPVLFDGWNPLDRIVDRATHFGITCVSAAANSGPSLVTVGSPGSARTSLTAGGTSDPIHARVGIELMFGAPGLGEVIYPHDLLPVDFAARGLTGDYRVKPDLTATAFLVFSATTVDLSGDGLPDTPSFGFANGTSFSAPTVSGAAALAVAYGRQEGRFARAPFIANVLKKAAIPIEGAFSQRDQGRGFVNVPGALELLERGHAWRAGRPDPTHPLMERISLGAGHVSRTTPDLGAAETFDYLLEIPEGVEKLTISFHSLEAGMNQNPVFGDGVTAAVHTAKRGGAADYVFFSGFPLEGPESFEWHSPEPGTARITIGGFLTNWGPVSGAFEAEATYSALEADWTFTGKVRRDEMVQHAVDVPEGLDALATRLSWRHDWTRWPTYDLDMMVRTPGGAMIPIGSIDSPELGWFENPEAGEWTFFITDFSTVLGREPYRLDVVAVEVERDRTETFVDLARARIVGAVPNPARGSTEVEFAIPARGPVTLRVYDVAGRNVRTLVDGALEAGEHRVRWDGRTDSGGPAATGVFFLRLETEKGSSSRKVVRLN